jgi:hypothetical protein
MIDAVHAQFLRWAEYVLQPVPGDGGGGYGKNILLRILEGKGSLMPGAPSRSPPRLYVPPEALVVEAFLKEIDRKDARLIKVFYLSRYWTVEKRADKLKMSTRSLYLHLDRIHYLFLALQRSK